MKAQTILAVCVCFLSSSLVASESTRKRRRRQRLLRIPGDSMASNEVSIDEFLAKESFDSDASSQSTVVKPESPMNGIDERLLEEFSMSMSYDLRQRQRFLNDETIDEMMRELESTISMSM
eukprot:jgi/Psemu1/305526/fgenesh1_kg.203_\